MDANFSLFEINIPDYLILRARATSNPGAEVGVRAVLGPGQVGTMNFLITDLQPVNHFFDLYESVDGIVLTNLLGTFTYDVRRQKVTGEVRYYIVDSGINNSPADQDTSLTDAYLDGKNVVSFEKRAIGPLVPDGVGLTPEYSISGTTITLDPIAGIVFQNSEVYVARISYLVDDTAANTNPGFFKGIKTVTANITMDTTYRNNRIKCNGAGTQLVITFEHVAAIPNGSFWYFVDQDGGAQYQTKLLLQDGNFLYNGTNYSELWIGKADKLWIECNDGVFEVIDPSKVMYNVGKRSAEMLPRIAGVTGFPNLYPEDNSLWSADDLPAIWYWLTHALPNASYYLLDNNLDSIGYTRPVDIDGNNFKAGLFIISLTKRKFRFPDTRGLSERGSKSFDTFGADANRLYDYPGGLMLDQVGPHDHEEITYSANAGGTQPRLKPVGFTVVDNGPNHSGTYTDKNKNAGHTAYTTETIVRNISVIYYRHV